MLAVDKLYESWRRIIYIYIYIFHCFVVAIICQQRTKFLVKLQKDQYSECSYMIPDEKTENENKRITFTNELYDCKVTE